VDNELEYVPIGYNDKRMNPTIKRYILSSITTFVTVFAATVTMHLGSGSILWTTTFWLSLCLVAMRAAVKAVVESFAGTHADA
jgi:hypothetical protein